MTTNVQFTPSGKAHLCSRAPAPPGPWPVSGLQERAGGEDPHERSRFQQDTSVTRSMPVGHGAWVSRGGQGRSALPAQHSPAPGAKGAHQAPWQPPSPPASFLPDLVPRTGGRPGEAPTAGTQTGATSTASPGTSFKRNHLLKSQMQITIILELSEKYKCQAIASPCPQSSRYVSTEQPCLKTTGLYDGLSLVSRLFHFFYFVFRAHFIQFMFPHFSISFFFFLKPYQA